MNRKKLLNILSAMLVGVVFVIAMLAVMILSGAISLTRTELVFATSSAEAVYDGKPLTNHNWSMRSGMLKEGHRARVVFTGSQTEAGESDNTMQVQIIDAAGADVTSDYVIRFEPGKLKVTPKSLTVTSKGASKIYDGTPLVNSEYEISDIVIGHSAVVLVSGSQTDVGFSPNTLMLVRILDRNGKDVTDNYRITKQEEPLIVMQGQGAQGGAVGLDFGEIPEGVDVEQLKNTVLYRVLSNRTGKIYLKSQSYGDYTGRGFYEANKYTLLMDEKYSAAYLMSFALQAKNASVGEITVQIVGAAYALPYYMAFSEQNGYEIQTDDVQISGSASEYTVQYYVDDVTPAAHKHYLYMMYEKEYRQFVYENYLEIDPETKSYMDGIIVSEKLSASDPDIINKVAQFIQGAVSYNIAHDSSLDKSENIAVAFLRDYKEGVCRHYAMAATMLYRALGIPARYTVGTVADAVEGEWVDVTALMAHAWVEVYIDGIGWKMVEVTGGESAGGDVGGDNIGNMTGNDIDFSEVPERGLKAEDLAQTVLYKVYSDYSGYTYLKSLSYGDYTGGGFDAAQEYTPLLQSKYSAAYLTSIALNSANASKSHIKIDNVANVAYILPYYMDIAANEGYDIQQSDVKSEGGALVYSLDFYHYDVALYGQKSSSAKKFEQQYRSYVYENYLAIGEKTYSYMYDIIASQGFNASNPEIISTVAKFIQNAAVYNMEYDIKLDESDDIAVAFLRDYKEGVCRHYAMAATMLYRALGIPARYTAGVLANTVEGEWVDVTALMAHAWVEVYIDGIGWQMVEVTGGYGAGEDGGNTEEEEVVPDKKIRPVDVYMKYDGRTILYAEAMLDGFEKYAAQGYTYENLVVSGSRRDAGISQSTIERITVYDKNGKDVTNEFIFEQGIIQVYRWELNISSESVFLKYGNIGGQNVTYETDLSRRYSINVEYTADYNRIGEQQNTFTVTVKMLFGFSDVTDQVKINKTYGKLTIERREITVIAGSAEKSYDGTPLTCDDYFIDGALSDGDTVYICEIQGEQTNIGRSSNEITRFEICNSAGEIVTDKYEIKHETGTLRVTR